MTPKKAANSNNLCPICRKNPAAPTHHPFCSSRCADVDLGRWLKGNYAIPGEAAEIPDETEDKGE